MSIDHLLLYLEKNRGLPILDKSIIKDLDLRFNYYRDKGYMINLNEEGRYVFDKENDILSKEGILANLEDTRDDIYVFDEIESTNLLAKDLIKEKNISRGLVIANRQTRGRGRLTRSFYSPKDKGIYMTYIPKLVGRSNDLLTIIGGLATKRAVFTVTGLELGLKWVNDLYYDGKKLGGILSEGVYDHDLKDLSSAIIGIGLNVKKSNFPEDIKGSVASLRDYKDAFISRNKLIGEIVKEFDSLTSEESLMKKDFLDEYRASSIVIGKRVRVIAGNDTYYAKVLDIDQDGALLIQKEDRTLVSLTYGEISLRLD